MLLLEPVVELAACTADIINAFKLVSFMSERFEVDAHRDEVAEGSELELCCC